MYKSIVRQRYAKKHDAIGSFETNSLGRRNRRGINRLLSTDTGLGTGGPIIKQSELFFFRLKDRVTKRTVYMRLLDLSSWLLEWVLAQITFRLLPSVASVNKNSKKNVS